MQREHPPIPFERYADAILAPRPSAVHARGLEARLAARFAQGPLALHPTNTPIGDGKVADRRGTFPQQRFDCLGSTVRPRPAKNRRGQAYIHFTPAVSARATTAMRQTIRSW